MISPGDLLACVIRPTLNRLELGYGANIEQLLLGTAMQESGLGRNLAQVHGPARGLWQMEPATAADIWQSYLAYRKPLAGLVTALMAPGLDRVDQLAGNLYYACAMTRVHYMRVPEALPAAGDIPAQAQFYVQNYNRGGKATAAEYIKNWHSIGGTDGLWI